MLNWKIFRNNSFTLTALLAGVSFLLPGIAGGLSLFLVFLFGALISWKVPERKVRHAALLPVLPSLLLQLLYFSSQAVYYPGWLIVFMVLFNLATVIFFGFLGGLIPWYIDTRKNKDKEKAVEKKSSAKDQFQKNLNRLVSVIVLASFALQLVAVPVAAATQVSTDEYIQNYEPEQKTSISAKEVMPPPKNRAPKEGLNNLTPEQLKQYCLESGLAIGVTECAKFAPPPPPPVEQGYWENVFPEMYQSYRNFEASAKKVRKQIYNPGKKLTWWDQVKGFGIGVVDTSANLITAFPKMSAQFSGWVMKNPIAAVTAFGHAYMLTNPLTAQFEFNRATSWVYKNRGAIGKGIAQLNESAKKYGYVNTFFAALGSKDAVDAAHRGEIGYALGRGISEFSVNVLSWVTPAVALKVPAVGEKLAQVVNISHKVNEVLSGSALLIEAGKPAGAVIKTVAETLGWAKTVESTISKVPYSEPVVKVIDTIFRNTASKELASNVSKTSNNVKVLDAVTGVENRAAKLSAAQTATKSTAKDIANMYDTGKSYNTTFKYLNTSLTNKTTSPETVSNYISTVSKNKGLQVLVSDTSRPAVAQTMTEMITHSSSGQISSYNKLGTAIEKSKLTPVAVKTFADGTSEVLAVSKKGVYTVNYVSKDGKIISNVYKPKVKGEEEFVQAYLGAEGGGVANKTKSTKSGLQTASNGAPNAGSSMPTATEIVDKIHENLPPGARDIDFHPTSDPRWGFTYRHIDKHLTGSDINALTSLDPAGNIDIWSKHIAELAAEPTTAVTPNGMLDISKEFPKSDGNGTFKIGMRIAPDGNGKFEFITLLTDQARL